jgi:hypothetical protein
MCASLLSQASKWLETIKLNDIIMFTYKRQAEKGKIPGSIGSSSKNKGIDSVDPLRST